MNKIINLIKETLSEWSEDKVSRLAAALAYYTTFSLPPLLVLVIALLGLIGYQNLAESQILVQIENLIGAQGRDLVESMIQASALNPSAGIAATLISLGTLLFGALGVFGQLQDALNTIWEVAPKPQEGLWATVKSLILNRLLSFSMILVIGFLLLISLVLSSVLASLNEFIGGALPLPPFVLQALNFLISFGVITLLFAFIFKVLPDAEMDWGDVWFGAAVTSLLFSIGKFLIGLYLGQSDVSSSFGAAGSLVILLIWIYYSAQIVFLGAEFTQVYANMYGSRVRPADHAVALTEEARARQGLTRRGIPAGEPRPEASPLLAPTGAVAVQGGPLGPSIASPLGLQPAERPPFGFIYRGEEGRKGVFGKLLYGFIVATQFVPALRNLASTRASAARQRAESAFPAEEVGLAAGQPPPAARTETAESLRTAERETGSARAYHSGP